jgi:hypothetical protein
LGEKLPREDGVWVLEISVGMKHEICVTTELRSGKIGENTKRSGYSKLIIVLRYAIFPFLLRKY